MQNNEKNHYIKKLQSYNFRLKDLSVSSIFFKYSRFKIRHFVYTYVFLKNNLINLYTTLTLMS